MSTDPVAHQAAVYDPPPDAGLQALYMDEHLLVVDKPSGLLTVPGRGDHLQDCLIHRVQRDVPEALIVHRLDMATSGLVVLARGADMQRQLSKLFMNRQVDKRYEAVLHGLLAQDIGEIDLPLITDWPRRPRQMVDHVRGKPSQTRYQVMARDEVLHRSRVDLEPLTGRSHQLRVHCLAIGHAILGDPLYGPDESRQASDRLLLHATTLTMPHPVSGVRMQWAAPCPF
jgi:tRNA pseudouridine32 synthase/23S rRNA pseudouridine746 synthase